MIQLREKQRRVRIKRDKMMAAGYHWCTKCKRFKLMDCFCPRAQKLRSSICKKCTHKHYYKYKKKLKHG